MGLFFQILGGLFILLILFVVVVVWVIKNKLQRALKAISSVAKTPAQIHLTKLENIAWKRAAEAKATIEPLQKLGFTPVGNFAITEMAGVQLMAFTHAGHNAYAVVYEHPQAGVWAEIYSRYIDGQPLKGCTYSNVHHPGSNQIDTQPNRKSVKVPNLDVDALFTRFINERSAYELEPVQPDQFAVLFEKAYADEMEWRKNRGGTSEEEIRRVADATGRQVDDATVQEVKERMDRRMEDAPPAT